MEMLLCGRYRSVFKLNSIQFKILKAKYNVKESPLTCSNTLALLKMLMEENVHQILLMRT